MISSSAGEINQRLSLSNTREYKENCNALRHRSLRLAARVDYSLIASSLGVGAF